MLIFTVILSIVVGLATTGQSSTNAALGKHVGPLQASFVSFSGGLVVCSVICAFAGTGSLAAVVDAGPWMLLGGLYGAFIVFSQATCAPRLGVALTFTLTMLGQLVSGFAIDTLGLLGVKAVPVSGLRVAGCLLAFSGIACVYVSRIRYSAAVGGSVADGADQPGAKAHNTALFALLCFCCGVVSAVQTPTNAALGTLVGTMEGSVVNFAGGFASLLVVLLLLHVSGKQRISSFRGIAPWKFTGGLYGAFGVPAFIICTPVLGVSLSLAGLMFGQLLGGMLVDSTGAFGALRMRTDGLRIAGAVLLLAGVALVTLARMGF